MWMWGGSRSILSPSLLGTWSEAAQQHNAEGAWTRSSLCGSVGAPAPWGRGQRGKMLPSAFSSRMVSTRLLCGWEGRGRMTGGGGDPPLRPARACAHLLAVQGVGDPRGLQLRRQEQLQPDGGARGLLLLDEERDGLGLQADVAQPQGADPASRLGRLEDAEQQVLAHRGPLEGPPPGARVGHGRPPLRRWGRARPGGLRRGRPPGALLRGRPFSGPPRAPASRPLGRWRRHPGPAGKMGPPGHPRPPRPGPQPPRLSFPLLPDLFIYWRSEARAWGRGRGAQAESSANPGWRGPSASPRRPRPPHPAPRALARVLVTCGRQEPLIQWFQGIPFLPTGRRRREPGADLWPYPGWGPCYTDPGVAWDSLPTVPGPCVGPAPCLRSPLADPPQRQGCPPLLSCASAQPWPRPACLRVRGWRPRLGRGRGGPGVCGDAAAEGAAGGTSRPGPCWPPPRSGAQSPAGPAAAGEMPAGPGSAHSASGPEPPRGAIPPAPAQLSQAPAPSAYPVRSLF